LRHALDDKLAKTRHFVKFVCTLATVIVRNKEV
jgi:hypothetical protein